jgi:hypothetical protein
VFDQSLLEQFRFHVYFYGGILMRWQLYDKRLELLKAVKNQDIVYDRRHEAHVIGEIVDLSGLTNANISLTKASNVFAIEVIVEHLCLTTPIRVHNVIPHPNCQPVLFAVSQSKVC